MFGRMTAVTAVIALMPAMANAYIGPGMGLGVIASLLGLVAAFFMVMIALLWFPLKRMIQRIRAPRAPAHSNAE